MPRLRDWPARSATAATSTSRRRRYRSNRGRQSPAPGRRSMVSPCCCSTTGSPTFCGGSRRAPASKPCWRPCSNRSSSGRVRHPPDDRCRMFVRWPIKPARRRFRNRIAEPLNLFHAHNLGKAHRGCAKHLTLARNRFRTAASQFLPSRACQFQPIMPAIPSNKPYRIGRSRTGLGLFATKPIKKGAKIIRYFGPLLDSRKKKDDAIENKYLFELNGRWTIDGSVRKNIARYINHACKPNAESDVNARKRKVVIRAIKNIEPGDEINYDYGTDYFKAYLKPIGCKCAACEKKRQKKRAEARAEKARL